MFTRFRLGVAICLVVAASSTIEAAAPPGTPAAAQEAKAETPASSQELILQQLRELMNELQALREEVDQLKQAVDDIHRVAVRPRTPPPPTSIELDDDEAMGSPDAKIALVEFSDFQCPYCRRFHDQTFPELKSAYIDTGKLRYIFRNFPLAQIHPQAMSAAVAANCAAQQGKYWEMHDALFANQSRMGPELYPELAQSLDLDGPAFQACLDDPAQEEAVKEDLAYGQSVGIRGTPYYFIGRLEGDKLVEVKPVSGAQPFQAFANIIDPLLK